MSGFINSVAVCEKKLIVGKVFDSTHYEPLVPLLPQGVHCRGREAGDPAPKYRRFPGLAELIHIFTEASDLYKLILG